MPGYGIAERMPLSGQLEWSDEAVEHVRVVVIGAGPYGLAVSAYLRHYGVEVRTFGRTMEYWQRMPEAMHLKSSWSASSIADPQHHVDLDHFIAACGIPRSEPIPLPQFCAYGLWFQRQAVPDVLDARVIALTHEGSRFLVSLEGAQHLTADRVVIATGLAGSNYLPDVLCGLPDSLVSHTQQHTDLARFCGRQVAVLGRGQSALETAALLHENGASVEIIARGPLAWINRGLYERTGLARHLFYPPSDVGPPGINWLVHYPGIIRFLPSDVRMFLVRRATRPAGARWLRARVEGHARVSTGAELVHARPDSNQLVLTLTDGTLRRVDHLFAGTGFQPVLARIGFLSEAVRALVHEHAGFPLLHSSFESTVPGIYFVGAIASYSFGPLCRFVAGTGPTARRVARHIISSGHQHETWPVLEQKDSGPLPLARS